jgi:2-polyprenyl-6-methoxyphenol hydroxylase-like FAD-dependent oxidoreductase
MTAALLLAERGVETAVVDSKGGPAAHSYACALHPHSLELFDRLGLIQEILASGRRFDGVAFYEGDLRRAEIKLSQLPAKFPFLVVLPQSALERLLERALKRRAGIQVNWHHQFADLQTNGNGAIATVEKLGGTSVGYIVPHWETVVQKTIQTTASFLIGADGYGSVVRQRLGINYEQVGDEELFTVFEFETDEAMANEVRVVLDESTSNVFWPLPGGRCRWSFQARHKEPAEEFPEKARRSVWVDDPAVNRQIEQHLQQLTSKRAPWFTAKVKGFDWVDQVSFERRLVKRFGDGRCWLVGDAAHQTGPIGVQSLNVGLREAEGLVETLQNCLRNGATAKALDDWNHKRRETWQQLFGLKGALKTSEKTDKWVEQRASRILPCLPASGDELAQCAKQLCLELP